MRKGRARARPFFVSIKGENRIFYDFGHGVAEQLSRPDVEYAEGATMGTLTEMRRRLLMLGWALTFLVVALIAAILGFGGIAGASAGIAQILFFVFIVLFAISLLVRTLRG